MYRRLVMASAAMVLAVVGSATAQQPEAPKVNSWSNSKTADSKTVFQVKTGEKITFTIRAKGAAKYLWEVNGTVQKGVGGASFKWTVPDKKGLWKVRVKAANKSLEQYVAGLVEDFRKFPWMRLNKKYGKKWIRDTSRKEVPETIKDGYYPPQCRKEWIVSTFLKQVKPGESIPKAIDAIPPEGGIIEILPGLHNVRETIHINKSNVAICGTDKSEIKSLEPTKKIFIVNENWKDNPALENITFRGFKITAAYSGKNTAILLCKVKDSTIEAVSASSIAMFLNTGGDGKHPNNRITIRNNTLDQCMTRVFYAVNTVVAYNTIISPGVGYGLHFEPGRAVGYEYVSVHHNRMERKASRGAHIQTEAPRCHFFNNTLVGGSMGITIRYYPDNCRVERNVITGATYAGIQFLNQTGMINDWVTNNRIFNCPGHGIIVEDVHYGTPRGPSEIIIANNVIYNNGKDGICRGNALTTPWSLRIVNNIIANNGGYGINLASEKITETHNYNNIWNNKKGKYNKSAAGAGDMSVDPLFADLAKGDFRLKSKAGRWDPKAKKWVKDNVQSPCINAGDPKADFSREPVPNGGRVNVGAYGNTPEASKSVKK